MAEGCGNHGCHVQKPEGLGTNGLCTCMNWRGQRYVHELRQRIAELERRCGNIKAAIDHNLEEARAEERERCIDMPMEPPKGMHDPQWWMGYNYAITLYRDRLRALGEE